MFTIRFNRGPGKGYTSYAAVSYDVVPAPDGASVDMELSDGGSFTETVGPAKTYTVAYVTNAEGKTIDRIPGRTTL